MKKRALAMLLVLALAVSLLPVMAMAAGTTIQVTDQASFAAAIATIKSTSGDFTVVIGTGVEVEFVNGMELNGSYSSVTFKGESDTSKITINQTAQGDYLEAHGKTVKFTNLILAKADAAWHPNSGHMGNYFSIQGGTVTYENCTFPNGACTSGGTAVYNNCTFQNASEYGLWVYDDALVTVNGGTIDSKKGIKVYSEDEASVTSTLTVQNATFTENVTAKPAVAIGYAKSVTLLGNTYNNPTDVLELDSGSDADCEGVDFVAEDASGNDIASTLTAVDRSNNNAPCGVLVDGKIYTTVTEAAADATDGSTVTLLHDSQEDVEFPEDVTLDKNGYDAPDVTGGTPPAPPAPPVPLIPQVNVPIYRLPEYIEAEEVEEPEEIPGDLPDVEEPTVDEELVEDDVVEDIVDEDIVEEPEIPVTGDAASVTMAVLMMALMAAALVAVLKKAR